jgi:hypothetical protein
MAKLTGKTWKGWEPASAKVDERVMKSPIEAPKDAKIDTIETVELVENNMAELIMEAGKDALSDVSNGSNGTAAGDLPDGLAYDEVPGGLTHDVVLEAKIEGAPMTDPKSMVMDGGKSPLDAAYDAAEAEIAAETAAGAGNVDGGPAGADAGGDGVKGSAYVVEGVSYTTEDGFQGSPKESETLKDSPLTKAIAEAASDAFIVGAPGSVKDKAIKEALAEQDKVGGGTAAEESAGTEPTGGDGKPDAWDKFWGINGAKPKKEGQGYWDYLFGDDEDDGSATGSDDADAPESSSNPDDKEEDKDDDNTNDDTENDSEDDTEDDTEEETEDDTDDETETGDDGTEPPPDEEDYDPENPAPGPMTDEQKEAVMDKWEGQQTWDVTPGWDDPSGDNPDSEPPVVMETGKPIVNPKDTVDAPSPDEIKIPDDASMLFERLGNLVQPTDDDDDGVWGGPENDTAPVDPWGGTNPAAQSVSNVYAADVVGIAYEPINNGSSPKTDNDDLM